MHFPLPPLPHDTVDLLVFRDVSNAKDLRALLITGQFSAAFLKPNLLVDIFQVLVAVSTALHREKEGSMSTRNLFTEILYNLSPTRNITKALQRFGIADDSTELLVVIPNASPECLAHIRQAVHGTEHQSVSNALFDLSDATQIRKVYAISEEEERCSSLLDSVVTRMACRDIR